MGLGKPPQAVLVVRGGGDGGDGGDGSAAMTGRGGTGEPEGASCQGREGGLRGLCPSVLGRRERVQCQEIEKEQGPVRGAGKKE